MPKTPFVTRLKQAVTSSAARPLVLLANFEVEEVWARGETTLPRVGSTDGAAIVNRMDEFAIWLGSPSDTVFLKALPDPDFLEELDAQGFGLPAILAVDEQTPAANITQDVAADHRLITAGRRLGASGSVLLSHSVSEMEASVASSMGMTLAAPAADICKRVNGKVYSRRLADAQGIRQPRGVATETVEDWHAAVLSARRHLQDGRSVVVKEAYGVSGKGLAVVRSELRLDRIESIVATRAEGNGGRAHFSVEEWLDKYLDLNYQFTVALDGSFHFDFVKVAATSSGVHLGHSYPASLSESHMAEILSTSARIAAVLHCDGYFGVVGVDAIIDTAGTLYPMLEINARFNMSTYQAKIDELVDRQSSRARAKHYALRLEDELSYGALKTSLNGLIYSRESRKGIVINNFATVNAASADANSHRSASSGTEGRSASFPGRLYGVIIGDTEASIDEVDAEVTRRLVAIQAGIA